MLGSKRTLPQLRGDINIEFTFIGASMDTMCVWEMNVFQKLTDVTDRMTVQMEVMKRTVSTRVKKICSSVKQVS